jgi:hypothetical protein
MLAVFGAALKDCGKVFGVLAESALLLSSYMLVFGAKPPPEKVGSDRLSRRRNGVDLVSAVLRF